MQPMRRLARRGTLYRRSGLLLVLGSFCLLTIGWWGPSVGHWLNTPVRLAQVDAVAVLGGGFPYRAEQGIRLLQAGYAGEIWFTGSVPGSYGNSAVAARELAIKSGIAPEMIYLLASTNTWEDGQRIAELAQARDIRSVLIVTDWSHSRRALCIVRHHLATSQVAVFYMPPRDFPFTPDNWWQVAYGRQIVPGEWLKIAYYWLRYGLPPWDCFPG